MSLPLVLSVALVSCAGTPVAPTGGSSGLSTEGAGENVAPTSARTPTPTPTPTAEAVIVVLGADVTGESVTASGYVVGFLEDGGSCSFVFSGDGREVVATSVGTADRQTTSCGAVTVDMSEFSSGSWNVTLTYAPESSPEIVTSVPSQLEIP